MIRVTQNRVGDATCYRFEEQLRGCGEWMGKLKVRCGALAPRAALRRVRLGGLLAVALGLGLAGCATAPQQVPAAYASARGPTIAFESIDGPPESIFRKYVQNISDEANARQMAIV